MRHILLHAKVAYVDLAGHWLKPLAQRIPRGWTVIDRVSPTQLKLKVDLRPARLASICTMA